jgi:hypothetical protein
MHVCVYACIYVPEAEDLVCVRAHLRVYVSVCMLAYKHVSIYACMYVLCMRVFMYAYMSIGMHVV